MATTSITPTFQAGGLISGLDSQTMIDKLVALRSSGVTRLQTQKANDTLQVSLLGQMKSLLGSVQSTVSAFSTNGISAVTASGGQSGYSVTTGAGALPSSYDIQVDQLATTARMRSATFTDANAPMTGGTLHLSSQGKTADIGISDGMALGDVAKAINAAGLQVSAQVLSTGQGVFLSLTNLTSGYSGSDPTSALSFTFDSTGSQGSPLGLASVKTAQNAKFSIDGVPYTNQSNVIANAIPGVTLSLKAQTSATEPLELTTDVAGSQANLQKFVDSYNALTKFLAGQLSPPAGTDISQTLAGDNTLRDLQQSLQHLTSLQVSSTGTVRSLADLGLKTNYQDGTLSIDATAFANAMASSPSAVKSLFTDATNGLAAQVKALDKRFDDPVNGAILARTTGLNTEMTRLDAQIAIEQTRVDSYRELLLSQFNNMETVLAKLKTTGNYLTQQSATAQLSKQS